MSSETGESMNVRRVMTAGLLAAISVPALLLSAQPASAYGNGWEWCDKITVKSSSNSKTARLTIGGQCDGGRVSITGSMGRRDGSVGLRGSVGSIRVQIGGVIGNYTAFGGYMDDARIRVDGSGSRVSCDMDQWLEGDMEPAMVGNLFVRMCPILNGLLR